MVKDTFRSLHPNEPDHYTWWRQFGGMREANGLAD